MSRGAQFLDTADITPDNVHERVHLIEELIGDGKVGRESDNVVWLAGVRLVGQGAVPAGADGVPNVNEYSAPIVEPALDSYQMTQNYGQSTMTYNMFKLGRLVVCHMSLSTPNLTTGGSLGYDVSVPYEFAPSAELEGLVLFDTWQQRPGTYEVVRCIHKATSTGFNVQAIWAMQPGSGITNLLTIYNATWFTN